MRAERGGCTTNSTSRRLDACDLDGTIVIGGSVVQCPRRGGQPAPRVAVGTQAAPSGIARRGTVSVLWLDGHASGT